MAAHAFNLSTALGAQWGGGAEAGESLGVGDWPGLYSES